MCGRIVIIFGALIHNISWWLDVKCLVRLSWCKKTQSNKERYNRLIVITMKGNICNKLVVKCLVVLNSRWKLVAWSWSAGVIKRGGCRGGKKYHHDFRYFFSNWGSDLVYVLTSHHLEKIFVDVVECWSSFSPVQALDCEKWRKRSSKPQRNCTWFQSKSCRLCIYGTTCSSFRIQLILFVLCCCAAIVILDAASTAVGCLAVSVFCELLCLPKS